MRILDKENIEYNTYTYDQKDGKIDGISVAKKIGKPFKQVYKTIVTQGLSKQYYVFIIPVDDELNLKAIAKIVNEKAIEMIKISDINKVTGYIRGGCSPIGMKKEYKTVIDSSCKSLETMIVSAGKIGYQIELKTNDLIRLTNSSIGDLTVNKY